MCIDRCQTSFVYYSSSCNTLPAPVCPGFRKGRNRHRFAGCTSISLLHLYAACPDSSAAPCACVECMRPAAQAGGARTAERRAVLPARPSGPALSWGTWAGARGAKSPETCSVMIPRSLGWSSSSWRPHLIHPSVVSTRDVFVFLHLETCSNAHRRQHAAKIRESKRSGVIAMFRDSRFTSRCPRAPAMRLRCVVDIGRRHY